MVRSRAMRRRSGNYERGDFAARCLSTGSAHLGRRFISQMHTAPPYFRGGKRRVSFSIARHISEAGSKNRGGYHCASRTYVYESRHTLFVNYLGIDAILILRQQ